MEETQLSIASVQDYGGKLLLAAAIHLNENNAALKRLESAIAGLTVQQSPGKEAVDEKERIRAIMTEFEAVVDAVRLELAGRVKSLKSEFDDLKLQWGSVDGVVRDLQSSLSSQLSGAVDPLQAEVAGLAAQLAQVPLALNGTLEARLADHRDTAQKELDDLRTTVGAVVDSVGELNAVVSLVHESTQSNVTALAAVLEEQEHRLQTRLSNLSATWEEGAGLRWEAHDMVIQQLTVNSTRAAERVEELTLALGAAQASAANVSQLAELQGERVDDVFVRLVELKAEALTAQNASLEALHADIMAEFSLSRREQAASIATLNATMSTGEQGVLRALSEVQSALLANVTAVQEEQLGRSQRMYEDTLTRLHNASQLWLDGHDRLNESLSTTVALLRAETESSAAAYHNLSMEAVAELAANTSQVVARSNSILARAIGEVNATLLAANASWAGKLHDILAEVKAEQAAALSVAAEAGALARTQLAVEGAMALQQAEVGLAGNITALNGSLYAGLSGLEQRLQSEVSRLDTAREQDLATAGVATAALTGAIRDSALVLEGAFSGKVAELNTTLAAEVASLSRSVEAVSQQFATSLTDGIQGLAGAVYSNATSLAAQLTASMERSTSDHAAALQKESDKLRYALSSLNASTAGAREEDRAAVSAQWREHNASLMLAHSAFLGEVEKLRGEQAMMNSSAYLHAEALSAALRVTVVDLNETTQALAKQQTAALHNATATLTARLTEAQAAANATQMRTLQDLHGVNASLVADVQRVQNALQAAIVSSSESQQEALQAETLRLRQSINSSALAVSAAADASISTASASLRSELNSTLSAFQQRIDQEAARVAAAHVAGASALKNESEKLTAALTGVTKSLADSLAVHAASVAGEVAAQAARLTALNSSLLSAQAGQALALTSAVADLRTVLSAINSSSAASAQALAGRVDALDTRSAAYETAAAAQISSVTQKLSQQASDTTSALAKQWADSQKSVETVRVQAILNTTAMKETVVVLVDALSLKVKDNHAQLTSALADKTGLLRSEVQATAAQAAADLARVAVSLNASMVAEAKAREAADAAAVLRMDALNTQHSAHAASSNQSFVALAADVRHNQDELGRHEQALAGALKNITAQHGAHAAQVMGQVEARVREAEVQQRLGAVVVEAVRNDTAALSQRVSAAQDRLSASELSVGALRAEALHLAVRMDELRGQQGNLTFGVLPDVHAKMGALQRTALETAGQLAQQKAEATARIEGAEQRLQEAGNSLAALQLAVGAAQREARDAILHANGEIAELQRYHTDMVVQSNLTAAAVTAMSRAVDALKVSAQSCSEQGAGIAEAERRSDAQQKQIDSLLVAVKEMREERGQAEARQREADDAQALRVKALEETVARQQALMLEMQEDNHRLLREGATTGSVNELRKLLFELQAQMLGHSGKVLDLLLQPRSAVLVHNPCGGTPAQPVAATAQEATGAAPSENA